MYIVGIVCNFPTHILLQGWPGHWRWNWLTMVVFSSIFKGFVSQPLFESVSSFWAWPSLRSWVRFKLSPFHLIHSQMVSCTVARCSLTQWHSDWVISSGWMCWSGHWRVFCWPCLEGSLKAAPHTYTSSSHLVLSFSTCAAFQKLSKMILIMEQNDITYLLWSSGSTNASMSMSISQLEEIFLILLLPEVI